MKCKGLVWSQARVSRDVTSVCLLLQDLNVNFRTIILPETLKCLASETASVLAILASLDALLDDVCGVDGTDALLTALEGQLDGADSGVEVSPVTALWCLG